MGVARTAFAALGNYGTADEKRRARLNPVIEEYLSEARRVAPDKPATLRGEGLWKEECRDWQNAVADYLASIRSQPEDFYAYRRAWACAARLSLDQQRALWHKIEPLYLENSGPLPNAAEMVDLLVERFGVRETETIVEGWRKVRPQDPNGIEAFADLLLNHGQGHTDARRAMDVLRPAAERFPYHSGLRFSLAKAYRVLGDLSGAREVFEELSRRQPDNNAALIQFAWVQHQEGQSEQALETLRRASQQEPQDAGPIENRALILIEAGRFDEAKDCIADGLCSLPDSVRLYRGAVDVLKQCGLPQQAVEAARRGTRAFPQGAYLWLLLGKTLKESPVFSAPGEIELCLRRSLNRNHSLYETADWTAIFLEGQRRYQEALDLLYAIEPRMPDPSPVLGRIAWIKRQSGKTLQAVTDLADVTRRMPWYTWGWNLLLTWLEEDKNWKLSRELLTTVPPTMLTHLGFRQKRLQILERAGVAAAKTDREWDELLQDFPNDLALSMRRYDSLTRVKRYEEAAQVLRRVVPLAEHNVYILARLVEVECKERQTQNALDHALEVCFSRVEDSEWPVDQVFSHMRSTEWAVAFQQRFSTRLRENGQPTRRALALHADRLLHQNELPGLLRLVQKSPLNFATREITRLLHRIEASSWVDDSHMAPLLAVLNKKGYRRLIFGYRKRATHRKGAQGTGVWAQVGHAMINAGKRRAARKHFEDWRTRTGVEMWMLSNYLLALPRLTRNGLQEVIATCEAGLAALSHDHCARYVAYVDAEAHALIGDKAGLLRLWERQAQYFAEDPKAGEYFPSTQTYAIKTLHDAVRRLKQGDDRGYSRSVWWLKLQRFWNQSIRKNWGRTAHRLFTALVLLTLVSVAISALFK